MEFLYELSQKIEDIYLVEPEGESLLNESITLILETIEALNGFLAKHPDLSKKKK